MDTFKRVGTKISEVLGNRVFSVSTLAVITAVLTLFVSLNLNTVVVAQGLDEEIVAEATTAPSEEAPVVIENLKDVSIKVDGLLVLVSTDSETVADVLKEINVVLDEDDEVNFDLDKEITENMDLVVDRVNYEEYTETKPIAFKSVEENSDTLYKGETKVTQEGVEGVKEIIFRNRFVNSELALTEAISEGVKENPVNKITLKGTKDKPKPQPKKSTIQEKQGGVALDSSGAPVNYTKLFTGMGTAYTSDRGDSGTVTSTGQRAQHGIVAVNPNIIPYGTKLYITSADGSFVYGYAIAGDTGGAAMSGRIIADLFFETYGECTSFGRRSINVYVVG